jgi:hypothetical protein
MKKIIWMVAGLLTCSIAFAQQPDHPVKHAEMKHLTKQDKNLHQDRMARNKNILHGHKTAARMDNAAVQQDKRNRNNNASTLRNQGVRHPKVKARIRTVTKQNQ